MVDTKQMNCTEIEILVPWGHVAGKTWGKPSNQHVLAIHGKQDNCGVFDRLIPLLTGKSWGNASSENRILMVHGIQHNCGSFDSLIPLLRIDCFIIAVDLPGHGFSAHFPRGLPFTLSNFVCTVKLIVDYLKWDKFSYIGHSFGGQIGTYLAALYPQNVRLLIVIDTMEPRPVLVDDTLPYIRSVFEQFSLVEHKLNTNAAPVYSYEEVFAKVQKNRFWKLSTQATNDLMKRSVKPHNGGFILTGDQRLKCPMRPVLTFEQQEQIVRNISCPILFVLAEDNCERYGTYLKQMFELNSNRPNCSIVKVAGDHAVHQNYPERVSHLIDEFLNTKLISNGNESANGRTDTVVK